MSPLHIQTKKILAGSVISTTTVRSLAHTSQSGFHICNSNIMKFLTVFLLLTIAFTATLSSSTFIGKLYGLARKKTVDYRISLAEILNCQKFKQRSFDANSKSREEFIELAKQHIKNRKPSTLKQYAPYKPSQKRTENITPNSENQLPSGTSAPTILTTSWISENIYTTPVNNFPLATALNNTTESNTSTDETVGGLITVSSSESSTTAAYSATESVITIESNTASESNQNSTDSSSINNTNFTSITEGYTTEKTTIFDTTEYIVTPFAEDTTNFDTTENIVTNFTDYDKVTTDKIFTPTASDDFTISTELDFIESTRSVESTTETTVTTESVESTFTTDSGFNTIRNSETTLPEESTELFNTTSLRGLAVEDLQMKPKKITYDTDVMPIIEGYF